MKKTISENIAANFLVQESERITLQPKKVTAFHNNRQWNEHSAIFGE